LSNRNPKKVVKFKKLDKLEQIKKDLYKIDQDFVKNYKNYCYMLFDILAEDEEIDERELA